MDWVRLVIEVGREVWIEAGLVLGAWALLGIAGLLIVRGVTAYGAWREAPSIRSLGGPLARVVLAGCLLRGLGLAVEVLAAASGQEQELRWFERLVAVAWIAVMVVAFVRGVSVYFLLKEAEGKEVDPTKRSRLIVIRKIVVGSTIVLGVLFALQASGIDPGPLLAGGAIGGVIIGLALQESLSNVFSGLLFALDPSVRVGDHVRLENGREGFVRQIGWRSTLIRQLDDTVVVVPNAMISRQQVLNLSRPAPPLTIWVECSVAYDDDLDLAERSAIEAARAVQRAHHVGPDESLPEPFVRWQGFGESGVSFRLFIQADTPIGQYRAKSDLVKALHKTLGEAGVTIPYPVRDIRVSKAEAGPSGSTDEEPYSA